MEIDGLKLPAATGNASAGVRPAPQHVVPPAAPQSAPATAATATVQIPLVTAVESINRYLRSIDQTLRFQIDDATGKTVVRVIDEATGDTIRQIPSEETLAVARALGRSKGFIFDKSA